MRQDKIFKIGIDLDNTIINYELAFKKVSVLKKLKIKNINKEKLKNKIIKNFSEGEWTTVQGEIYGKYINFATPYKGFKNFLRNNNKFFEFFIISHKSKFPILGKKINLHKKAKYWLKNNKISYCDNSLINNKNIFFLNTKKNKIKKIKDLKIDYFIDDLEEILNKMPRNIGKIKFGKSKKHLSFDNWIKISEFFKKNMQLKKKKIFFKNAKNNQHFESFLFDKKIFIKKFFNNKITQSKIIREYVFTKLASEKKLNVPKPIYFDLKSNYIIFEYLSKQKIKKLNEKNFKLLKNFLIDIQVIKKCFKKSLSKNFYAIESFKELNDLKKNIDFRFNNIKKGNIFYRNKNLSKFLDDKLNKLIKIKFLKYKNFKIKRDIISPSDFGVHNLISNKKNIYFSDFEYCGIDSSTKLLSDTILQPSFLKSLQFSNRLKSFFFKKFKINKYHFHIFHELNKIRWILIILNEFSIAKNRQRTFSDFNTLNNRALQLNKAKIYLNL